MLLYSSLQDLDYDNRVLKIQSTSKAFGLVAPRDFICYHGRISLTEKKILHYLVPVEAEEWGPVEGHVR